MNVLIIPEDFRKDQHVVKPIIKRMFAEIGKPNAKVLVCFDPLLGGIGEALKWSRIAEILDLYRGMVQVFLLLVDRDGVAGRRQRLDNIESRAAEYLGEGRVLFGENAWQEIEVWAIAGQDLLEGWNWQGIRKEIDPKETYFEPLARSRGLIHEPGEGRKTLGREAAANYTRLRSRCQEDLAHLETRLADWLKRN
jgi:hypothetical protein